VLPWWLLDKSSNQRATAALVSLTQQLAETEEVMYRIRAASWPRATLARVGQPIVRALQARFRRQSAAAMTRATRIDGVRR